MKKESKDSKQLMFEMLAKIDPTFKPKLNENLMGNDDDVDDYEGLNGDNTEYFKQSGIRDKNDRDGLATNNAEIEDDEFEPENNGQY